MKRRRQRVTLLELVRVVQDATRSDAEVIAVIRHMVNTKRVILSGTFAGKRL